MMLHNRLQTSLADGRNNGSMCQQSNINSRCLDVNWSSGIEWYWLTRSFTIQSIIVSILWRIDDHKHLPPSLHKYHNTKPNAKMSPLSLLSSTRLWSRLFLTSSGDAVKHPSHSHWVSNLWGCVNEVMEKICILEIQDSSRHFRLIPSVISLSEITEIPCLR